MRKFFQSPFVIRLVAVAAIIYFLYSQNILFRHVIYHLSPDRAGKDRGCQYEDRLARLRPFLPPGEIIGYSSDVGLEFFLRAQYVLAPAILTSNPGPRWMVANFANPSARSLIWGGKKYIVIKEWGNGVSLLKAME